MPETWKLSTCRVHIPRFRVISHFLIALGMKMWQQRVKTSHLIGAGIRVCNCCYSTKEKQNSIILLSGDPLIIGYFDNFDNGFLNKCKKILKVEKKTL
jgi:hypothetical protein